MSDTDAILALIDGALDDVTSPDAMRWTADPQPTRTQEYWPLTTAGLERARDMLNGTIDVPAGGSVDAVAAMLDLPVRLAASAGPPPAPTLSDLLDLGRWLIDLPRIAARLEVDAIALQAIRDRVPPSSRPPQLVQVNNLFSLPIVVDENLPPGGWRFVDADGNVMQEGAVLWNPPGWLVPPPSTIDPRAAIRISGV